MRRRITERVGGTRCRRSMSSRLSRSTVVAAVCGAALGWEAAERCCKALRTTDVPTIRGHTVDKSHIERIYTIRLSRTDAPRDVIGSDRLLADLAGYDGKELTMAVLGKGLVATFTACSWTEARNALLLVS